MDLTRENDERREKKNKKTDAEHENPGKKNEENITNLEATLLHAKRQYM